MSWDLLFLLGGGFALAKGAKECGLTEALGETLRVLEGLPSLLILCSLCTFTSLITELTSNVAICNLIVPIVLEMCVVLHVSTNIHIHIILYLFIYLNNFKSLFLPRVAEFIYIYISKRKNYLLIVFKY